MKERISRVVSLLNTEPKPLNVVERVCNHIILFIACHHQHQQHQQQEDSELEAQNF
jgi:hypothetical protein